MSQSRYRSTTALETNIRGVAVKDTKRQGRQGEEQEGTGRGSGGQRIQKEEGTGEKADEKEHEGRRKSK